MAFEPTSLYRFYAADGELLYVGITKSLPHRLGQHESDKPWFRYVETIKVTNYGSRSHARAAEIRAIQEESPAWNIADRSGDDPPRPLYVADRAFDIPRGLHRAVTNASLAAALHPDPGVPFHLGTFMERLGSVIPDYLDEDVA
jgi:predicted GIY-YIG superfamily endonuclease